ncbi:adenylyl cyclase-associated protein [Elysia marginata]|uniref:Adenylyl cyclase-associated protein n=1 Tax=Elysia marginata TaxID=1093978 RepID=A0AAV4EW80_9GAST|nr:adenylyl cyclase-associated protein [Elysia marginata]
MADSATFYTNRVLKEFKEKEPRHVQWCNGWIQFLKALQAYIKDHHTTGVSWNTQVSRYDSSLSIRCCHWNVAHKMDSPLSQKFQCFEIRASLMTAYFPN